MTRDRGTVVVWGLLANSPFGGMTWQVLHHLEGFRRLGFDVWYVEDSDSPWLRRINIRTNRAQRSEEEHHHVHDSA